MFWLQSTPRGHLRKQSVWKAKFKFVWVSVSFMSLKCAASAWDTTVYIRHTDLKGISMLQRRCCFDIASYNAYEQIWNHNVVFFEYFGAILDSIFSLDIVKMFSFVCMFYVDDSLSCESRNCHRCTSFSW